MLTLRVLGPIEASGDGEELNLGGPRQRRLLCSLIAEAGRVVSVERLAEQLWSDDDRPEGATQAVRSYVARLRRSLEDASSVIVTTPPGYALIPGEHEIDAMFAQDLLDEALLMTETDPGAAIERLALAAGLWRGAAYGEFADLDWLVAESQRLGELRRSIVEGLFGARLGNGEAGELVGELERAVANYPLSERLRGQLMKALSKSGRAADAARSFQGYREYLAEETGLEPGPELKELEADIVSGEVHMADGPAHESPSLIPTGTVTFLFTDIEGSTRLWAADTAAMAATMKVHDEVLRGVIKVHGGYVFTTAGDAFCVAFERASDAVACAQEAQALLAGVAWPGPGLMVRMGLHLGEAELRGGDYFGPPVNTAARVESAGHGGQVVLSEAVRLAADVRTTDLGVHELRDVSEPVHLHQVGDGDFPALRVVPKMLSNLPIPATSLIGREAEILQVRSLLLDHRLVTITGVGGSGKTRLAIEVAERELAHLAHGAYFADLSNVSDDDGVVAAVADAVRLRLGGGDPLGQVLEHLVDKQALVVLDNCEHVIDACAEFADAALAHRGQWRLVATSREHLDVEGEHVIQAPSLVAGEGGPAVELFADRAASVQPTFRVDDTNQATVVELCDRLDGMPLAIELAAARIAVMSPAEMLERIDDRFRLLSGGRRRTRQRQRTLEATLDWSYDLLDEDEQDFLRALGVMVGPFDVALAASVADVSSDEAFDVLASLVAKSLVVASRDTDRTLFRLLETVRAYAQDQLRRAGELEAARDRHLEHHLTAVAHTADEATTKHGFCMIGWDWAIVQRWLSVQPNLEAAIDWAIVGDRHIDAGELLAAPAPVWREHLGVQPILDRVDVVVEALPETSDLRERLWILEMDFCLALGDEERYLAAIEATAHASNEMVKESSFVHAANARVMIDPVESLRLADEAASLGLVNDLSFWDYNRADIHMFAGEYEEALALLRPHQGQNLWAPIDGTIAIVLLMDGQPSEALSVAKDHPMTDSMWMSFGVIAGLCHLALSEHEAAKHELVGEARSAALGRIDRVSNSALVGLAALAQYEGDVEWATEMILGAGSQRAVAMSGLARMVAEQIGVRDEFIKQQEAAQRDAAHNDRTDFLRETLARLDAKQSQ